MHTKTKNNTEPPHTMGCTINNKLATTEPTSRTDRRGLSYRGGGGGAKMHFTGAKFLPYILLLLKHKKLPSSHGGFYFRS